MQYGQNGAWLRLEEASARLGISPDMVRRRASPVENRDGTVSWMVWFSSVELAQSALPAAEHAADDPSRDDATHRRLRAELRELHELNHLLTVQSSALRLQLERAQETNRQLQAAANPAAPARSGLSLRWRFWRRTATA